MEIFSVQLCLSLRFPENNSRQTPTHLEQYGQRSTLDSELILSSNSVIPVSEFSLRQKAFE